MRRRVVSILAILLTGMGSAAPAQVRGFPLYALQVPRGISVAGDVGFASDDFCPGTCAGVGISAGLGRVGLSATGATSGYGGLVSLSLLPPGRGPFGLVLQAGAGGTSSGLFQAPFGVGFSVWIPTPIVSVQLWLGVRGQYMNPGNGWEGEGEVHPGMSAGLGFTLMNGLGVRAAYDRVFIENNDLTTFGVGVVFSFDPGL